MPANNKNLHGNVPDRAQLALLLIDVINDLEFNDGEKLLKYAVPAARRIAALVKRARKLNIPIIYINDNFGKWRSNFNSQLKHCLRDGIRGKPLVELLLPQPDDYFVLKPKHSAFFSTTLDTLLQYLKPRTLILAGFAGNRCVLFTASDAYMRDFKLHVPRDCKASNTLRENNEALRLMENVLKASLATSTSMDLKKLKRSTGS